MTKPHLAIMTSPWNALFYNLYIYIVICRDFCVTYRRVLDLLISYTFNSGLQTTISLPLFPHNLQFTITHTLVFSVFTSLILATDFNSLTVTVAHYEVFFAQPNSLLAIILLTANSIQFLCSQAHILAGWRLETRLDSTVLFFIIIMQGPRRKRSLSIVGKAWLQRRCIAMEVTRLLLEYSLPEECVYWVVAKQWMSVPTSLFRLSGILSQCISFTESDWR
jgi:hypothetical protein